MILLFCTAGGPNTMAAEIRDTMAVPIRDTMAAGVETPIMG